jgi:hypothetical protein
LITLYFGSNSNKKCRISITETARLKMFGVVVVAIMMIMIIIIIIIESRPFITT